MMVSSSIRTLFTGIFLGGKYSLMVQKNWWDLIFRNYFTRFDLSIGAVSNSSFKTPNITCAVEQLSKYTRESRQ